MGAASTVARIEERPGRAGMTSPVSPILSMSPMSPVSPVSPMLPMSRFAEASGADGTAAEAWSALAVEALLDEARLTPKPGLVDARGRGAHADLDLDLMCRSAHALAPWFAAMAQAGARASSPTPALRETLGLLGRKAEAAMLRATGGINTHRGAIWALGLLVAAAAMHASTNAATGPANPAHSEPVEGFVLQHAGFDNAHPEPVEGSAPQQGGFDNACPEPVEGLSLTENLHGARSANPAHPEPVEGSALQQGGFDNACPEPVEGLSLTGNLHGARSANPAHPEPVEGSALQHAGFDNPCPEPVEGLGLDGHLLAAGSTNPAHPEPAEGPVLQHAGFAKLGRNANLPQHIAHLAGAIARLPDRHAPQRTGHNGERACREFGVTGARGQAQAGFPQIIANALPELQRSRARGDSETASRLNALLALMSQLDDTCVLSRAGLDGLQRIQSGAAAVLVAGGVASLAGRARLKQLDAEAIACRASPGGAADLLAATLFLDRLETTHHATA